MRPDGVNGSVPAQKPSLAERIDNVNASDTTNLSKNINDISTDVNKKIQEFFSQGSEEGEKISVNEKTEIGNIKTSLMNLYYNMRNKYVQAEQEYKQLLDNLLDLISRTTDASNGKKPNEVALEPQETDAKRPQFSNLKQLSDDDLIAEAELLKSDFHLEGNMKRDYESCFTNIWGSGRKISQNDYGMIKSNLVKFQAKYTKELHNNNSFEKIDNYGKIETQISYYEELAERDTQKNNQVALNNTSLNPPSKEKTEAYYAAIKKELNKEGDPRANYSKETDFLNN